ncbi:hypothetical protein CANCADRAFT_25034 [Tortispora caseinolytica NRRL Y-17796]|uniref:AP complex subunit beta n=1 Tax=Tortispora caseinolytica NRRL Y-17796 TaxID=767744 RepID=A0A1E4THG3_9ASCO|nr:hypothetical protein CANCADRAFT_25034 [Tortispora caseinolytica NRRL Y-17796]
MSLERRIRNALQLPKKGEAYELQAGLVSQYAFERKDAIQRVIAQMTLGKDVSGLFPDVLKNIATHDIEQKKLVYLYLINYAKSHPDLCILAVNTFVQDSENQNPLVRALAIRTMGCIRVDKIIPYLMEPLRRGLKDESPYVRKTAAIGVSKLHDLDPQTCIEDGFLSSLQELITDPNAMVIANAVSALAEIQETNPSSEALVINSETISTLLTALNECSEWGRISLLSSLAHYKASSVAEAEHICERVTPQFQHANTSVVLSAIRAILAHIDSVNQELQASLVSKMAPSLVSFASTPPEVQYVAFRSINLILQKYPTLLSKHLPVFFCKYNDPPYLKVEKLNLLVQIVDFDNYEALLQELKEYAVEVDIDFVRRAIQAIAQMAIKIDTATTKCIEALLDIASVGQDYAVEEVVSVMKDIVRRYPSTETTVGYLMKFFPRLEAPEPRLSIAFISGEFCDTNPECLSIIASMIESFDQESPVVQMQILTAAVKAKLKDADNGNQLNLDGLFKKIEKGNHNPDLRDRAFMYSRIISAGIEIAKLIIASDHLHIDTITPDLPVRLRNEFLRDLACLSAVYQKPVYSFLESKEVDVDKVFLQAQQEQKELAVESSDNGNIGNLLDIDFSDPMPADEPTGPKGSAFDDLLSLGSLSTTLPPVNGKALDTLTSSSSPVGSGTTTSGTQSNPFGSDLFGLGTQEPKVREPASHDLVDLL